MKKKKTFQENEENSDDCCCFRRTLEGSDSTKKGEIIRNELIQSLPPSLEPSRGSQRVSFEPLSTDLAIPASMRVSVWSKWLNAPWPWKADIQDIQQGRNGATTTLGDSNDLPGDELNFFSHTQREGVWITWEIPAAKGHAPLGGSIFQRDPGPVCCTLWVTMMQVQYPTWALDWSELDTKQQQHCFASKWKS